MRNKQFISMSHKINLLQKKGLLTVLLIILGESIALTNAVKFWSTYQNWSNTHGRGRFANHSQGGAFAQKEQKENLGGDFFKRASSRTVGQECQTDNSATTCSSTTSTSPLPSQLHPRKLARAAASIGKRTCSDAMYKCCNASCPSCIQLDIRGGHMHTSAETIAAETILNTASKVSSTLAVAPYGLSLNMWKVIFQIFLTALNVACWLIPLRAKKITENKVVLGLANAFSGGVFLTLAFGHLIPECVHGFEGMNEALPYMIVLGGYLLIFFVEKVAFDAHGLMHEAEPSHEDTKDVKKGEKVVQKVKEAPNVGRSAVILLGALAVHSVLEMTALGLADTFGDSALLSLSIALHQPAESIALLVAFLKSGMPKPDIIKYLSIFSACGPIGVAIGMAVNEFAAPIIDSIMLATVAGTFIYVGATEVIPEEWEEQDHKWKKFFALMSGIVSIFAITQYTMTLEGHSH